VTVPEFLASTTINKTEIAERCGVDLSQISRWENGKSLPQGEAAFILNQIAGGAIRYPEKKRRRRAA
jgi:transcriptional regulator with XRE-family HTH domain